MQIIQGILGMALGFAIVVFRVKIKDITGNIAFAERYLGTGGTWTFLWMLGLVIFIVSLMWATGSMQDLLIKYAGPLLGR